MNLLDRFSTHLRDTIARAIQLAAELKNPEVCPAHLFFSLSNQKGSVAMEILSRYKIDPKVLEEALLDLPMKKIDTSAAAPGPLPATLELAPLSEACKHLLEQAMVAAHEHKHNYIGTEHLLLALLNSGDRVINQVLQISTVPVNDLKKQLQIVMGNVAQFPQINEIEEVIERIEDQLEGLPLSPPPSIQLAAAKTKNKKPESALEFFATNLTGAAAQKNIDPVIGRQNEIERVIQILCRRTKNNPLLLGDPGIGKTAIVEGLAKRISEGKAPEMLLNKKIYALDMGLLIAGTIYRGEFEGRLRQVIDEVTADPNIILFIDEMHNIVGAGNNQGAMDAANLLKPKLARGLIRCIGATTPGEFKKYIEADPALERRFQPIYCSEPNVEDTALILAGVKPNYEKFHQVAISDEAVKAAARLSDRYITNKFLPDKAIDLLDETAAAKRLQVKPSPNAAKRWALEKELELTIAAKETAAKEDKFNEAVELKKKEEKLRLDIKNLTLSAKTAKLKSLATVTAQDVIAQVAKMVGAAPAELLLDDKAQLTQLEDKLKEQIIGQDEVIYEVSQLIRQAKLGLGATDRPLASFLFVGETGVGKTELAKVLAHTLYPSKDSFIKLDMSEFSEPFGASKLLGSPAGYVGFKDTNQFTDKIKLHPYCVILFDEIDKAHKDIVKLLLQMLENGEITDAAGKKVSLKHAIIILTTTTGAAEAKRSQIGFNADNKNKPERLKTIMEKLKEHFSPEVVNRVDKICLFKELGEPELIKIAGLELNRLNERLKNYHTTVSSDPATFKWLIKNTPEKPAGAREVRRYLSAEVEALISRIILEEKLKPLYKLAVKNNHLAVA